MEHSSKNTDCYFFYYSTCAKGDNCPFRHEPSALGCETMCAYWQQGNCLNKHCNFRHMELKKNRKSIPCYWETQPGGCRKPHCSFLHKNVRTITGEPINPVKVSELATKPLNQEWLNRSDDAKYDGSSTESDQGRGSSEAGSFIGSPAVDPLIVKFEEESDNESVPSPVKPLQRKKVAYCKTYEEIRLEEIQAESAAYYSYEGDDYRDELPGSATMKTPPLVGRTSVNRADCLYARLQPFMETAMEDDSLESSGEKGKFPESEDFKILSLEEIRRRKREKARLEEDVPPEKRSKPGIESTGDFLRNAIKSLDELKSVKLKARGVKRSIEEDLTETLEESCEKGCEESCEKSCAKSVPAAKVPPVRLKRTMCKMAKMSDEKNRRGSNVPSSRFAEENLSNKVEIRLCDSSTDDGQVRTAMTTITTTTTNTTTTVSDVATIDEQTIAPGTEGQTIEPKSGNMDCDSMLNITEEEYLTLDTASDDILKDIDALLKDKTPA